MDDTELPGLPFSHVRMAYLLLASYVYMYTGHCIPTCLRVPLCMAAAAIPPSSRPGRSTLASPERGRSFIGAGRAAPDECHKIVGDNCWMQRGLILHLSLTDSALKSVMASLGVGIANGAMLQIWQTLDPKAERSVNCMITAISAKCSEAMTFGCDCGDPYDRGDPYDAESQPPSLHFHAFIRGVGLVSSGAALGGALRAQVEALLGRWRGKSILDLVHSRDATITVSAGGFTEVGSHDISRNDTLIDAACQLRAVAALAQKRGFRRAHVGFCYHMPTDTCEDGLQYQEAWMQQRDATALLAGQVPSQDLLQGRLAGRDVTALQLAHRATLDLQLSAGGLLQKLAESMIEARAHCTGLQVPDSNQHSASLAFADFQHALPSDYVPPLILA
jgi:hypothetical protein